MASLENSIDGRYLASAEAEDSSMSAILDNLVAQLLRTADSEYLNNAINIALELFAEAPAGLSITASVYKNLGFLFEMRYRQQNDFDDLQTAITWAEQGAATGPPGDPDRIMCLSNLASYLVARYDTKGCVQDVLDAGDRIFEAEREHRGLNSPRMENSFHIVETAGRVKAAIKKLQVNVARDPISEMIAELASHANNEPAMLSEAISLAETILTEALPGDTLPIIAMNQLGLMLFELYQRRGNLEDLQKAITWCEQTVAATPLEHRAGCLSNLGIMLGSRFNRTGAIDDLESAIMHCEQAVAATPLDHPDRAGRLTNLSSWLGTRFDRTGALDDLESAIMHCEQAVAATPLDHPDRAGWLSNLGIMLGSRFNRTGAIDDLESAIMHCEQGVAATPLDHPDRAGWLSNLGIMLGSRFNRTGAIDDLESAILRGEQAVAATPLDHPDRAGWLSNLGIMLGSRFNRTGAIDDLESAILRGEQAVAATPLDHPDRAGRLTNLSSWLGTGFERTGALNDLESAIMHCEQAVAATPLDHPDRAAMLNNLSSWLGKRFERTGALNDLESAIMHCEQAVAATPLDHPDRAVMLNNLGNRLGTRFDRTGALDDLESAILHGEQALAATPLDHPDRAVMLNNLGNRLGTRFDRTGAIDDLESAIMHCEQGVAATPLDHPDRPGWLSNLGIMLGSRFNRTGAIDDLESAILRGEQAVAATPLDHPDRAGRLTNLSSWLGKRFDRTGAIDDLESAILRGEQAVAATPLDHPDRAVMLNNLGNRLGRKYQLTENQHDCERAVQYFKESFQLASTPPAHRIAAAMHAIPFLANKWVEISEITEAAVTLLPHVSLRSLDQNDLQHIMKDYSGLASTAAAAALQAGKPAPDAARLLELGRGVIANLQFETRTELSDLRDQYPNEAEEFERLRDELDLSSDLTPVLSPSRRNAASRELDTAIQKIRQLPNFEQFLLPPSTKELMNAVAPQQTYVLINVSSIRCDAFLIQRHNIKSVALPDANEDDIREKVRQWSSQSSIPPLQWLWDTVAGPVLDELGFQKTSADRKQPRICWIPTGPLCVFPIHAAGYHFGDFSRTVLDRVVSSYSPSVKALLYARRNKARTKEIQPRDKFVLACMEKTPGLSNLPFVETEIKELGKILDQSSVSSVVLETPQRAEVLEGLRNCKVFHFAGHGDSDPIDPSKSSLFLSDWQQTPLTVKDVIALKLHQNPPFLAYLSACSTAKNQVEKLLDEGIHLMAACQLAGFQHVIGSLWEVSDKHCVDVAKDVYDTILQSDMSDDSVSLGLHRAVLNLRKGPGAVRATREERNARPPAWNSGPKSGIVDPRHWAAYIHMGI